MMTVNYNEAMALIKPDTLLICVDVNEPSRMIFPNFIDDDNNMNVGVIDHHRRGSSQFKMSFSTVLTLVLHPLVN